MRRRCYHQAMFLLTKPDRKKIEEFLDSQRGEPFSYPEPGASRVSAPPGYNVDHNRAKVGHGRESFSKAKACLNNWKMFDLAWAQLFPTRAPIEAGTIVGVLIYHLGFWSLNASRIVYTIDTPEEVERYGFAYGTLSAHAEEGEERFTVEYHHQDQTIWYDLYAFSKPGHVLAKLGYPISRMLQKRFARDSLAAMKKAVAA